MNICLIEPFFAGSHKQWAESYQRFSRHKVEIMSLSGQHWKWRMHGAAITLSDRVKRSGLFPDLILATDMLDVAIFKALCGKKYSSVPLAFYLHENQLTYPWSLNDTDMTMSRDNHYGFINYTSALAADRVYFNSDYHRRSFLHALRNMLAKMPDHKGLENCDLLSKKCEVLHLGVDLKALQSPQANRSLKTSQCPLILWNHRWEYDKGPDQFFNALIELAAEGIEFELAVLGQSFKQMHPSFMNAKEVLKDRIIHWGFCESRNDYARWLNLADILPVTSIHDYFGISVVEAISCGVRPLLPNRLAYPEHLIENDRKAFLYNEGEFELRLRSMILEHNQSSKMVALDNVLKYDWTNMAPVYDRRFERITC